MTVRLHADRKGWPLRSVSVRVHHVRKGLEAKDRFEREIVLEGDLGPEQRRRLLEIANRCPVHNTLEQGVEVFTVLAERDFGESFEPTPSSHTRDMLEACQE